MARTRSAIRSPIGIIHHGRGDAGLAAETIRQVGGHVELAAADVDLALRRLAKGDDARVEAMDQRAEGQEVQGAVLGECSNHFSFRLNVNEMALIVNQRKRTCRTNAIDRLAQVRHELC